MPPDDQTQEMPEWARGDPLMEWYATEIWGKRIDDDDGLFEIMCLQVFQAGLTWHMILARRDAFRAAFDGWRIDSVAAMGPEAVDALIGDASIIRNRKKIEACIRNAQTVQEPPAGARLLLRLVLRRPARRRTGRAPAGPASDLSLHGAGDRPDVAHGQRAHPPGGHVGRHG